MPKAFSLSAFIKRNKLLLSVGLVTTLAAIIIGVIVWMWQSDKQKEDLRAARVLEAAQAAVREEELRLQTAMKDLAAARAEVANEQTRLLHAQEQYADVSQRAQDAQFALEQHEGTLNATRESARQMQEVEDEAHARLTALILRREEIEKKIKLASGELHSATKRQAIAEESAREAEASAERAAAAADAELEKLKIAQQKVAKAEEKARRNQEAAQAAARRRAAQAQKNSESGSDSD